MRLFTAIGFHSDTRTNLLEIIEKLQVQSDRGRFTAADNLHLTLVFLGECDEEQLAAIQGAMDKVTAEPFPVQIYSLGRFHRPRGDIWWAGVAENQALRALQEDLASQLRKAGLAFEDRPYTPHITLGRNVRTRVTPWPIQPFGETVVAIVLMQSESIEGKLTYTSIHEKLLNG